MYQVGAPLEVPKVLSLSYMLKGCFNKNSEKCHPAEKHPLRLKALVEHA